MKMDTVRRITICFLMSTYCCAQVCCLSDDDASMLLPELQLADLELVDVCEALAESGKTALFEKNYNEKIIVEESLGHLLRMESSKLKVFSADIPQDVERNWTFLVRPGDGLLSEEDWNTLITYQNANEEIDSVIKIPCLNNTEGCIFSKSEYQSILKKSKDVDLLNGTWFQWQYVFNSSSELYSNILLLVKRAALLNEKDDVTSYWEFLNDFEGAYSTARHFWEDIKPLYLKLHNFVKKRLFKYYNISDTFEDIPVYLLGSNFGNDWSHIADIILPHPQLHYDAEFFLKYKGLKEVYLLAENLTDIVQLGKLGDRFWSNSRFNLSFCEPQIFSFCNQEYTELYDCNETSWVTYLNAHESVFKVALRNQDYVSLMRQNLRYSSVDEAVVSLGSLLAIDHLPHHGIVSKDAFNTSSQDDSIKMTKLLLTALRVLPKLAYYLAVDEWRLKVLESYPENIAESWWQFRKEYQLVSGVTNAELDFIRDSHVSSNKPYLSKFLGEILAFQFLEYYRNQLVEPTGSIAEEVGKDPNFLSMIKDRSTTDWPYLITLNYGFELSSTPLLEYFKPLEKYFEDAPLEQVPIVTTTTTTTTTTPKPATTSVSNVHREVVKKGRRLDANLAKSEDILSDDPKVNRTVNSVEDPVPTNTAMYAGIGIAVLVSCAAVAAISYKQIKKKRRRTNNRRFAT